MLFTSLSVHLLVLDLLKRINAFYRFEYFIVSCKYMNFREQYTLMYHSNIFRIIHGHIISYTFVNSFFPPRYMKIYFTANIIFSAVVPQTLRIMQAAYGQYITLNSILHYAYWVEVHRAVHHKHSFPWMNRHII